MPHPDSEEPMAKRQRQNSDGTDRDHTSSSNSNNDARRRFERALETVAAARTAVEAAEAALHAANEELQASRQDIRDGGGYEPDSLLILSDGAGNPMICHIISFMTFQDVSQMDSTCKLLRNQASVYWNEHDNKLDLDPNVDRKSKAKTSKRRVLMHHCASTYASQFRQAADQNSPSLINLCHSTYDDHVSNLPDQIGNWDEKEHKLYIELSKTGETLPFIKGFYKFRFYSGGTHVSVVREFNNLSAWPEFGTLLQSILGSTISDRTKFDEETFLSLKQSLEKVTLVAAIINKSTMKGKLVLAQSNFFHGDVGRFKLSRDNLSWDSDWYAGNQYSLVFRSRPLRRKRSQAYDRFISGNDPVYGAMRIIVKTDDSQKAIALSVHAQFARCIYD